jgi:hypothetical protein
MHRDGDVDSAAVAQTDPVACPVQNSHLGARTRRFQNTADGIVASGFARHAAQERELPSDRHAARHDGSQRQQYRRQRCLLFADALTQYHFTGQAIVPAVAHLAGERVTHGCRRLRHGVGHEHQRAAALVGPERRLEITHPVAADLGVQFA